jgi:hypothetical protein
LEDGVNPDDIRTLGLVGHELWCAQLIGTDAPSHQKRFDRMKNPQVGDLVMEISTFYFWAKRKDYPRYPHIDAINAVGILKKVTREPCGVFSCEIPSIAVNYTNHSPFGPVDCVMHL